MICMLVELLMSLRWQSVLVLHDLNLDPLTLPSLEEAGISYINYDISIFTEEHPLTFPEDLGLQQDLNVLLLCDVTSTVSFLRQYGLCDKRPKTPVDFCHHSRVLIVGSRDYLDPAVDDNIQVENLAVLELPGRKEHQRILDRCSWDVTEAGRMLRQKYHLEVDFSMDLLTIHSDRQDVADSILPPVQQSKLMILYKKENDVDKDQLMVFLRPVLPTTVILFGVSLILVTACLSFLRFFHKYNNQSQRTAHHDDMTETTQPFCISVITRIPSSLLEVYGASLKQGSPYFSSEMSERILLATWWIYATIIAAVYCGTIMATLAVRTETRPFNNMAELARREDYKIGFDESSVIHNQLDKSNQLDIIAVRQRVLDLSITDPDVLSSNLTKHFQKVENGKYAFLLSSELCHYLIRIKCRWEVIDSSFGTTYDTVHVPKSSPFKHDLQNRVSLLTDSGIIQKTFRKWLQSIPEDKCPIEEVHKPVAFTQLEGIFYAVGIGLGCSVLVLVSEVVWYNLDLHQCALSKLF